MKTVINIIKNNIITQKNILKKNNSFVWSITEEKPKRKSL